MRAHPQFRLGRAHRCFAQKIRDCRERAPRVFLNLIFQDKYLFKHNPFTMCLTTAFLGYLLKINMKITTSPGPVTNDDFND